jgi:hypothetical protein
MAKEIITIEDLNQFKAELIEEVKLLLNTPGANQKKEYLRSADVKKLLSISPGTLQNLRIKGLPYSKINGTCFYKYRDIVELLERNTEYSGQSVQ